MARHGAGGAATPSNPWRIARWTTAALILLLPLAAMQLGGEVDWNVFDFIFAGTLIGGTLGLYELAARSRSSAYRAGVAIALMTAFLIIWVSLAVGIIGSENHPANAMFGAVLAVAALGALAAHFRPRGMERALTVTAAAHVAAGTIALLAGWGSTGAAWPIDIIGSTIAFVALWLAAAWLFRQADREQAAVGVV